ncbi:LuxR C-terminal-related transcriptional regulator [Streptomyces lavendulae]|uniref:LuxR C-terminal-related transcriptional regulator n=1 Tax=Streptomyces lavendulae TaxID=1914 RepID=UPI0036B73397
MIFVPTDRKPPAPSRPWPFAGQESALETFRAALGDPSLRGLVVHGASGTGASRLTEECRTLAVTAGHPTTAVMASAATRPVPLGALAHLFPPGTDLSGPGEQLRAAAEALAPRAHRRHVLLVDDLHFLDTASSGLIRRLLDGQDVFLLAGVRTGDPRNALVTHLDRCDDLARIQLAHLDLPGTARLLRHVLGDDVEDRAVRRLHQVSRGDLRFLRELITGQTSAGHLTHDGVLWRTSDSLHLTPTLTSLVEEHIAQAGPAGRTALELLALAEPVGLHDLLDVAAAPTLQHLETIGLLTVEADRTRVRATLGHPLHGETLRAAIPAARRRELLAGQAARVRAHGARRREDLRRIAAWEATAGCARPEVLLEAARQADRSHAHGEVAALLDALPPGAETPETRLLAGTARFRLGDWRAADRCLRQACDPVTGTPDSATVVVSAALTRMLNLYWSGAPVTDVLAVGRHARTLLTGPAHHDALREAAAAFLTLAGHHGAAPVREPLAAEPAHPLSRVISGSARLIMRIRTGRAQDALDDAQAMAEEARHAGFDDHGLWQSFLPVLRTAALTELGRLPEALGIGSRQVGRDSPLEEIWLSVHHGRCAWLAGRPADARLHFGQAIAVSRRLGHTKALRLAYAGAAAAAALLGDDGGAVRAAERAAQQPDFGLFEGEDRRGEAWLLALRGRCDEAGEVLRTACAEARTAGATASLVALLTERARVGRAEDVLAELAEVAAGVQGALAAAQLSLVRGLAERDPDRLLRTADELSSCGARLMAAEAAATAAVHFRATGRERDAVRADRMAGAEAAWVQGASSPLLHRAGARVPEPLTARERDVADRAALRMPSMEIAETLYVSRRTVDNTLQRVYRKLGVTDRRQLAEALARAQGPSGRAPQRDDRP